jgi:hypothetical protein
MSWFVGTSVGKILNTILSWLTGLIVDTFTYVFTTVKNLLVTTPDVTRLPQVQMVTGRATTILDVVFVLAFLAAGTLTVVTGASEQARFTAKQVLPRLVFSFVAAHFSPLFCSKLIDLADGIASSLNSGNPSRLGAFDAVEAQLRSSSVVVPPLLFAILAAIITWLFAAVAFTFLTRMGVLVIIAVTGPLALACHALPQIEEVARLWWRSLIGCLAVPMLQVLALDSGETVLLDPHSMGFLFGVQGGGVMNLFVTIVLLWITVKIPGLVRTHITHSAGRNGAQIVKVLIVQRGLRLLTGTP